MESEIILNRRNEGNEEEWALIYELRPNRASVKSQIDKPDCHPGPRPYVPGFCLN